MLTVHEPWQHTARVTTRDNATLMIVSYSVHGVEKTSGNSNRGLLCCSSWRLLEYHRFFRVRLAGFYEDFCYAPRATDDISQRHFRKSVPLHRPLVYSSVLYGKLESISPKRRGAVAKC